MDSVQQRQWTSCSPYEGRKSRCVAQPPRGCCLHPPGSPQLLGRPRDAPLNFSVLAEADTRPPGHCLRVSGVRSNHGWSMRHVSLQAHAPPAWNLGQGAFRPIHSCPTRGRSSPATAHESTVTVVSREKINPLSGAPVSRGLRGLADVPGEEGELRGVALGSTAPRAHTAPKLMSSASSVSPLGFFVSSHVKSGFCCSKHFVQVCN